MAGGPIGKIGSPSPVQAPNPASSAKQPLQVEGQPAWVGCYLKGGHYQVLLRVKAVPPKIEDQVQKAFQQQEKKCDPSYVMKEGEKITAIAFETMEALQGFVTTLSKL